MTAARGFAAVLTALAVAAAGGCSAVPGLGAGESTYPLRIEFADVLNLPQGAAVTADGVRVGRLTDVRLTDRSGTPGGGHVTVEIAVDRSVRLPHGTTAELRQDTPLGDIHIALTEPTGSTGTDLAPGDTIPLTDTTRAPAIEDILAALSVFVGTGAVTDLQDIIRTVNGVLPADPRDTARLSATLGGDLTDLATDLGAVDSLLDGLEATLDQGVLANVGVVEELLTPYGVQQTTAAIDAQIGVIFVLTALGPVAPSTTWLGPLLGSLDAAVAGVVPMLFGDSPFDTTAPSNLKTLVDLIHTKVLPFAESGPKVDLTRIGVAGAEGPAVDEQTRRIIDLLRVIGAVR
ncbi:MlaD family protein [Nocardia asteroides]|uniref:Mce family protein n=1 Tax=Nocardia asteroides NBRC 15531 TaxID=1110697 RepID=U5EHZ7_NOCAS|nr:MlaD family protein [Nocardia asteroides]UGT51290.1 MlaD family protein [Nocardia asteroides]GAD86011.1 Mce family protein [Nocardia asteroides NBRC 15531]SFM30272.1 virulence factor Mce family protein [Nocardia asteroides]VEG35825.1 virulence factor Mce family protein [Nocardia asteroides]